MNRNNNEELEKVILEELKKMYSIQDISEKLKEIPSGRITKIVHQLKKNNMWNPSVEKVKIKEKIQSLIIDGYSAEEIAKKLQINLNFVEDFYERINQNGDLVRKEKEINFKNAKKLVYQDTPLQEILEICNGMTNPEILKIKELKIIRMHKLGYSISTIQEEVKLGVKTIEKYIEMYENEKKSSYNSKENMSKVESKQRDTKDGKDNENDKDEEFEYDDEEDYKKEIIKRKEYVNKKINKILQEIQEGKDLGENLEKIRIIVKSDIMYRSTFNNIIKVLITKGCFEYVIILINIKESEDEFNENEKNIYRKLKKQTQNALKEREIIKLLRKGNLFPNEIARELNTYEGIVLDIAKKKGIPTKKRGPNYDEWRTN